MSETAPGTLAPKLARAMGQINAVAKTGRNEHHRYNYAPASRIYEAVRAALAAEGVMVAPSIVGYETTEAGKQIKTVLHMEMIITDGSETMRLPWVAEGLDAQDKGINKAVTSALKYFLIALLLIPTDEADPDGTDDNTQTPQQRNQTRQSSQAGGYGRATAINWGLEQLDPKTGAYVFAEAKLAAAAYDTLARQYVASLPPAERPTKDAAPEVKQRHQKAVYEHWQKLLHALVRGNEYVLLPYQAPAPRAPHPKLGQPLDHADGASINDLRN